MQPVEPIETVELFPILSAALLGLLKQLPSAAWDHPTVCAGWSVKDVVAHLLGGTLNRLSFGRDKLIIVPTELWPQEYPAQVAYIDRQNAAWVSAARTLSPNVLIDFLTVSEPQLYQYFKSLPPLAASGISVSWAGETQSPNWFDIAREYTEKWHHQQHIREAVGEPMLNERHLLFPVLDTFLRALPHTYRQVAAAEGTALQVHMTGQAGGDWALLRQAGKWQLLYGTAPHAAASIELNQDLAWRLFTKGINPAEAQAQVQVAGDAALVRPVLQMVSIMA